MLIEIVSLVTKFEFNSKFNCLCKNLGSYNLKCLHHSFLDVYDYLMMSHGCAVKYSEFLSLDVET